jgi:hypothetical protein
MIKRILLSGFVFLSLYSVAQDPQDALRYSRFTTPVGTARSMAIGGALTGLGGDLSSAYVNPAGLALFKTNELVLSPGYTFNNNKSNYLGTGDKDNKSAFNFGSSGFIIASPSSGRSNWKNWTYGVAVNKLANFNNKVTYNGLNNKSSYSEKYLEELISKNVTDPNSAARDYPFGPSLAINTYLVEPELDANGDATGYYTLATPQTGVNQEQVIETKGGITDLNFAAAGNLGDKFYIGGSFSWQFVNYERNQTFKESDNTSAANNNFNYFTAQDYLQTKGAGLNLKVGMIYKPIEQLRIGLGIHTPTFYDLEDVYNTTVTTDLDGYAGPGTLKQSSEDILGQYGQFAYTFTSPWKFLGGVAYVIREVKDVTQQRGFISADIEYLDYGGGNFEDRNGTSGSFFKDLNNVVSNEFKNAINVRVGGELKFNTIMVRAGFGYFSNPYTDPDVDGTRMNLSGGLGYRNKGRFIDLTYVHQIVKDGFYPYRLNDNYFAPVNMSGSAGNLMLTLGFKF